MKPTTVDELLAQIVEGDVLAFDADGTLWGADVGETIFERGRAAGLVDDETLLGPVRAFADNNALTLGDNADIIWKNLVAFALADGVGTGLNGWTDDQLIELYALESWIFAGHTPSEITALSEALFKEGFADDIFDDIARLIDVAQSRGAEVYVLSGSIRAALFPGTRRLGIDDANVFGTDPFVDDQGVYQARAVTLFGDEKGAQIDKLRRGRPLKAAFGDAPAGNDRALLERATLPVVMNPRGLHQTFAEARAHYLALHL